MHIFHIPVRTGTIFTHVIKHRPVRTSKYIKKTIFAQEIKDEKNET